MALEPLTGKRILVTRAVRQAGKLSGALRELGATPVEVPVLEFKPAEDLAPIEEAIRKLETYDWAVFTSANAVDILAFQASLEGHSIKQLQRIAAVGAATAAAAENAGLKVSLIPECYVAESLVAELAPQVAGKRILLARAAVARDVIPDALRAAGAEVDVVDLYRNIMPTTAPALLRAALEQGIAAATFTSSSSVLHLKEAAEAAGLAFPFTGVAAISIGPITSETLRQQGWEPAAEARPSDISGLVRALVMYFDSL